MQAAEGCLKAFLQYEFRDADLLRRALTHRSAPGQSNERLEYLGDAVLGLVISEAVYRRHCAASEGDLSRLRAHLVRDASLAAIARDADLGEHLRLGVGEQKSGGQRRDSILADSLEALFAAVYLDGGFAAARDTILKVFASRLDRLPDAEELRDPKTRLQEWLQARGQGLPKYRLESVSGKAHQQQFEVRCTAGSRDSPTSGSGSSRRAAEQEAARRMLHELAAEAAE